MNNLNSISGDPIGQSKGKVCSTQFSSKQLESVSTTCPMNSDRNVI